jgi:hypothetical protein
LARCNPKGAGGVSKGGFRCGSGWGQHVVFVGECSRFFGKTAATTKYEVRCFEKAPQ